MGTLPASNTSMPSVAAAFQYLQSEFDAMPPVAAQQVRVAGYADGRMRLSAPLEANVNDKHCAFGGSLVTLLTLAGWSLVTHRLHEHGLVADVFVADSRIRYLAPLYADLQAEAVLAEGESWEAFEAMFRQRGKARIEVLARVALPDGSVATELAGRFVAKAKG